MTKEALELKIKDSENQIELAAREVEKYRQLKHSSKGIEHEFYVFQFEKWLQTELEWRHENFELITQLKKMEGIL